MAGQAGRRIGRLTARECETVTRPGMYGDGGNLYLQVDQRGNRAWVFRWQDAGGRVRKMGVGPLHTVSLADARAKAEALRKQLLDGVDPFLARLEARTAAALAAAQTISLDQYRDQHIARHAP